MVTGTYGGRMIVGREVCALSIERRSEDCFFGGGSSFALFDLEGLKLYHWFGKQIGASG